MESALALMFAVAAFAASDTLQSEAGLFATLTFGIVLANQRIVSVTRVNGFGETLEVLIIGALFILLGALVTIDGLREFAWEIVLLVAALVLIVRPLTTFVSLYGSQLKPRDRALIGWVDPRGIVAASTAATFTGSLSAANIDGDFLLPVVFGVILGTGVVYGLTAKPVARWLGVTRQPARGVGLVGNSSWLIDLARNLQDAGVPVLVEVLKLPEDAESDATTAGVPFVSAIENRQQLKKTYGDADLAHVAICTDPKLGIGVSALISHYGRRHVFRLPGSQTSANLDRRLPKRISKRPFGPGITFEDIEARVAAGATVRTLDDHTDDDVLMLAAVSPDGTVNLQPGSRKPSTHDLVIALVNAAGTDEVDPSLPHGTEN
jgi:hypothetical protein